jgi:exosortase/archaeosortase family protein
MRRIVKWILTSSILSTIMLLKNGMVFDKLSLDYIERTGAYPYAVLALCGVFLYSKRTEIKSAIEEKITLSTSLIGGSLAVLAIYLPAGEPAIQIFTVLLIWLGMFTALFGRAGEIPLTLLGVYGISIAVPPLIRAMGSSFPMATTTALVFLLRPVLAISNTGQSINFFDVVGERQSYYIDAACSGSAAFTVFLSIFFLMVLDRPLNKDKTGKMLLFGLLGTSLQNILRLVVLVFIGYLFGRNALWIAHTYAGYLLFPLWYAFFVYVYLRQAKSTGSKAIF